MKVTLDTNVLISGTYWKGDPHEILNLIDRGVIVCVLSEDIIAEYKKVLSREDIIDKVYDKNLVAFQIAERTISKSFIVIPRVKIKIVEDETDNKILECAVEGGSDYIITRDNHLLKLESFKKIKIITPEAFLNNIKKK
jgi:uncharacterized protein